MTTTKDDGKAKTQLTARERGLANLKPFVKGDPRINRKGAPKRGQSWRETVKRITDMTREEAIAYVGASTKIGKMLKELPPNLPIKDGLMFATIIAYGRDPSARMLGVIMDREEGRPKEAIEGGDGDRQSVVIPADLIAPSFLDAYRDIKAQRHTEYVFEGGRGSTKSSFVSLVIPWLMVNHENIHALILRNVKDTLRDSVYSQLQWAINELGLSEKFHMTRTPLEMTYLPTGQMIYFRGADEPAKIKSIKPPFGHIGILWFEELDQFRGDANVRNIEQSAIRGGDVAYILKSFNPPRTANNWANRYVNVPKDTQFRHHSNYLSVPREWLGRVFMDEAEHLKEINPDAYEHEYMGVVNGIGGMVFENLEQRTITDAEIAQFDHVLHGADWGYYPDPFSFGKCHYDAARLTLYIYDEYRALKMSNRDVYNALVKEKGLTKNDLIIADSAEPKSVSDFREYGANIRGAEKGAGSVTYSMKWLQSLKRIVIDPKRAPHHAQEFSEYEYERDKDGDVISVYPDKNNHAIDDIRYATNMIWRRRGE